MRIDRPLALRAALLGVAAGLVAVAGQFLPVILDAPSPEQVGLPMLAVSAAGFLVSPVLVLVLGYRVGNRRNVASEYGSVALSLAVGGAVGYLAGYAVGVLAVPDDVPQFAFVLAGSIYNAVVKAGWFAIAGVAGAAVAHFRAAERNP